MLGPSSSAVSGGGALGNAAVQHTGGYGRGICGTSFGVVACLPQWLGTNTVAATPLHALTRHQGQGGWDVIHFNWGLHDICASMYAPVTLEV